MSKTIRVKIGGHDYNLRSDDELKVRRIAEEVDTQMHQLRNRIKEQSTTTLSVLTALNIAEGAYESREQHKVDMEYAVVELEKMSRFLKECYSDDNNSR